MLSHVFRSYASQGLQWFGNTFYELCLIKGQIIDLVVGAKRWLRLNSSCCSLDFSSLN